MKNGSSGDEPVYASPSKFTDIVAADSAVYFDFEAKAEIVTPAAEIG